MRLEVKNLTKSFGEKEVLHGISFNVEGGKALGLLGRNGAGKNYYGCISCQLRRSYS